MIMGTMGGPGYGQNPLGSAGMGGNAWLLNQSAPNFRFPQFRDNPPAGGMPPRMSPGFSTGAENHPIGNAMPTPDGSPAFSNGWQQPGGSSQRDFGGLFGYQPRWGGPIQSSFGGYSPFMGGFQGYGMGGFGGYSPFGGYGRAIKTPPPWMTF